jgi:hypothetical protein
LPFTGLSTPIYLLVGLGAVVAGQVLRVVGRRQP